MDNFREPVSASDKRKMKDLCALVNECFPGKGFALLVFDFGGGGTMHYGSNGDRADICRAMSEWIEKNGGD